MLKKPIPSVGEDTQSLIEEEIIKNIRNCTTKKQLLRIFDINPKTELQSCSEHKYEISRKLLNKAMGNPKTHYVPENHYISQKDLFEWDCEVFLTFSWKNVVNKQLQKEVEKEASNDLLKEAMEEGIRRGLIISLKYLKLEQSAGSDLIIKTCVPKDIVKQITALSRSDFDKQFCNG